MLSFSMKELIALRARACAYEPHQPFDYFYRNTLARRSNESHLIRIMTFGNYGTELFAQTTNLSSPRTVTPRSDTPTSNAIVHVNARCSCSAENKNVLRGQSEPYHRTECLGVIYYRLIQSFAPYGKNERRHSLSSRFQLTAAPIHQVVRSHIFTQYFSIFWQKTFSSDRNNNINAGAHNAINVYADELLLLQLPPPPSLLSLLLQRS